MKVLHQPGDREADDEIDCTGKKQQFDQSTVAVADQHEFVDAGRMHAVIAGIEVAQVGHAGGDREGELVERVDEVFFDTLGQVLEQPGSAFASAQGLSPVKARISLMLALMGAAPVSV